jgi:hypothetical protein
LDRDVIAPKKAIAIVSAAVPRPVRTFEERMNQTPLYRDRQDWQVTPTEFERWNRFYHFTVGACSADKGETDQLKKYWSRKNSFVDVPWDGETVWCTPPFTGENITVSEIARHVKLCKSRNNHSTACFILPYFPGAEWGHELLSVEDIEMPHTYPEGSKLFFAPDGGNPTTRWPVQVW